MQAKQKDGTPSHRGWATYMYANLDNGLVLNISMILSNEVASYTPHCTIPSLIGNTNPTPWLLPPLE